MCGSLGVMREPSTPQGLKALWLGWDKGSAILRAKMILATMTLIFHLRLFKARGGEKDAPEGSCSQNAVVKVSMRGMTLRIISRMD